MEIARDRHLAEKYKVELPELSPEKIITASAPGAVYYVKRPIVMFGLENADDAAMEGIVQAHAWPLQRQEWKLDYWLERDFDVFVITAWTTNCTR